MPDENKEQFVFDDFDTETTLHLIKADYNDYFQCIPNRKEASFGKVSKSVH